jgi:selenocysteine lyase/cysteine desulfurase
MSNLGRRHFLQRSGLAFAAGLFLPSLKAHSRPFDPQNWQSVREQFKLDPERINMALMLLASHPRQVADAIEMHRKNFDNDPVSYWEENAFNNQKAIKEAAAQYVAAQPDEIALTDSTTMGLGILYNGLKLTNEDEILTTTHDHYSTEKSLEFKARRTGASVKRIVLYKEAHTISIDEVTANLKKAIGPKTRIVAVTWVHSSTGVKLPLHEMAEVIKQANQSRPAARRIYFCVDGVHGFGIGNVTMADLGCDFFVAGTHKWIFGPRGTGIIFARRDAWDMIEPTIPAFSRNAYGHWLGLVAESSLTFSDLVSPGGFHSFEHRWALPEAFKFHLNIGKDKIEQRTQQLSSMLKEGLQSISHVKLHTPLSEKLSAGINCFEVDGIKPGDIVKKLHEKNIVASDSPYRISYARLTPCIINTEEEVMACIKALENIKS